MLCEREKRTRRRLCTIQHLCPPPFTRRRGFGSKRSAFTVQSCKSSHPVLAYFYGVFLHNQEGTSAEKGGFRYVSSGASERHVSVSVRPLQVVEKNDIEIR